MADTRLEAALDIARERLSAISEGDVDRLTGTLRPHERACAALAGLRDSSDPADIQALGELIALEQQTSKLLDEAVAEAGAQLANLRTGEKTAAYRAVL